MTREEVIKLLEHISIAYTPTDAYGDYDDPQPYEDALNMAIEALSAEAVQGWIPCSERLPDVDVEVLTTTDWSEVLIAWYRKDGTWETDEYILANDEILAWMPLPKPYREDGEA